MRTLALIFFLVNAGLAHAAEPLKCPKSPTRLAMDRGEYTSAPNVVFTLENFAAIMIPRGSRLPLCIAKTTNIEHGRVTVSAAGLTQMFDRKLQLSKTHSLSDVKVETKGDHVIVRGKVHKVLAIPFEIEGPVHADGTAICLSAQKIKAAGVPVKGLLNMVGVELGSLINPDATQGAVTVQDNSLLFHPDILANIRGHLTNVTVAKDELVVDFGPAPESTHRHLAQSLEKRR